MMTRRGGRAERRQYWDGETLVAVRWYRWTSSKPRLSLRSSLLWLPEHRTKPLRASPMQLPLGFEVTGGHPEVAWVSIEGLSAVNTRRQAAHLVRLVTLESRLGCSSGSDCDLRGEQGVIL